MVECWQCRKETHINNVLSIPIKFFTRIWEIHWCFNCVKKQFKYTDYKLVEKKI